MRLAVVLVLVSGLVTPSAYGMGKGLQELLQALGQIGHAYNEATTKQNVPELLLFGGQGHKQFLGCLNCNEVSPVSVSNSVSQYGFANNFGVWNSFGEYASTFSIYSACNRFATDPPVIVDRSGNAYGRFSINQFATGSVCSAVGNPQACQLATTVCQMKG